MHRHGQPPAKTARMARPRSKKASPGASTRTSSAAKKKKKKKKGPVRRKREHLGSASAWARIAEPAAPPRPAAAARPRVRALGYEKDADLWSAPGWSGEETEAPCF